MASIIAFVFSVGGLIVALIIAAIWLGVRPASRSGRKFLICVAAGYTLASISLVPYGVSRILVLGYDRLSAADVPPGQVAIVVLGSGDETVENWDHKQFRVLDRASAARVWETYRVYHLVREAWVISSGGAAGAAVHPSVTMRDALVTLGIPSSRILIESESRNTHDEAIRVASMLTALKVDQVVLVTSDVHMRRSIGAFRAAGASAIPAIAREPFLSRPWHEWIRPTPQGLQLSDGVIHEFVGIAFYAAHGWLR